MWLVKMEFYMYKELSNTCPPPPPSNSEGLEFQNGIEADFRKG